MASSTHERRPDSFQLRALHGRNNFGNLRAGSRASSIGHQNRAIRAAFYRTLMRLALRYTIYEGDVVVIERPQAPDIVVDLSTGRVENAEG